MFVERMREAVEAARTLAQLDALARQVWQAMGAEGLDELQAQGLAELVETRRGQVRERIVPVGVPAGRPSLFPARRYQRSPDRTASRQRRRELACLHPLPSPLAARFTEGERAVLKIVADEVRASGVCGLCVDAIAARAGVCRRLVQTALRLAAGDGLLVIEERRREGRKNETNLVRIVSREWLAWIKRGRPAPRPSSVETAAAAPSSIGCKRMRPTGKGDLFGHVERGRNSGAAAPHSALGAADAPAPAAASV